MNINTNSRNFSIRNATAATDKIVTFFSFFFFFFFLRKPRANDRRYFKLCRMRQMTNDRKDKHCMVTINGTSMFDYQLSIENYSEMLFIILKNRRVTKINTDKRHFLPREVHSFCIYNRQWTSKVEYRVESKAKYFFDSSR